jgi:hypothetical protein
MPATNAIIVLLSVEEVKHLLLSISNDKPLGSETGWKNTEDNNR